MPISATASTAGEDPRRLEAIRIVAALQAREHTAYFAGGCVRDSLLGIEPSDYDVATDANPEQIIQIFGPRNTLLVGAAFGVVCVHNRVRGERVQVEVATFRSDGLYLDGRRPSSVRFASVEEDAARRDFTINGMYADPIAGRLIDLVGGEADLRAGVIRAIGDPRQRIAEDKLRMIRAVRFAARFGYAIESDTAAAIQASAASLPVVSGERLADELRKICAASRVRWAFEQLHQLRLLDTLWPELAELWDVDASAAAECLASIDALEPRDFAAVLGALAYELTEHRGTTAGPTLEAFAGRLRLSNAEVRRASFAATSAQRLLDADRLPWSQVQPIAAAADADTALAVARSIASVRNLSTAALDRIAIRRAEPSAQFDPPPLLGGEDLKRLGLKPGPQFRGLLDQVRAMQLDGELPDREAAIDWLQRKTQAAE